MCVYAASYSVTQAILLCLVCYACGGGGEPRLDTYPRATQGLPSAVTGEEDPHNTHLQSKEFLDEKERLAVEEGPLAGLCSLERPAVLPSTGSSLELRAPWQRRWPPKTESFVKQDPALLLWGEYKGEVGEEAGVPMHLWQVCIPQVGLWPREAV